MSTKQQAIEYVPLGYQAGTADRVYVLIIVLCETGYQTISRYGRRGAKLQTTTKTETGVTWATAKSAFDRMMNEQTRQGYEEMRGSERMTAIAPIQGEYDVIPPRDRDAVRASHPVTAAVTTPEQIERAARLEREERERAETAERERQALLAQNVRTLRANIDTLIPFVEPEMLHVRLSRKDGKIDIGPATLSDAARTSVHGAASTIHGSFEAQLLVVGERLIALTALGRRRPDSVFDGASVFTPARKVAILDAARASTNPVIYFFLDARTDLIALPIDNETRPILTGLIDLLSPKVAVAA
jgi:predicted DNA-binding WGR domain protein